VSARAGFTLIEMTVTLAVVAMLMSAAVLGVGAITGAEARSAAGQLAGTVQALFDQAALTGRTCRLVFELPTRRETDARISYRAECAESGVTTSRDRDQALKAESDRRRDADRARPQDERILNPPDGPRSLEQLLTEEEERVSRAGAFSSYTDAVIEPRTLPSSVKVAVWVRGQKEYVEEGPAMLFFFPQGYTEKAQILFTQGNDTWTLKLEPLTGRVTVVPEALEVPRS